MEPHNTIVKCQEMIINCIKEDMIWGYLYSKMWSLILRALIINFKAPTRQGPFQWSTLHLAFYWPGNFDRVVQKIQEQSRNLRVNVSRAHWSSLSARRRAKVQALSLRRSRANLSTSRGFFMCKVRVLRGYYKIWIWSQWVILSNWKTKLLSKDKKKGP